MSFSTIPNEIKNEIINHVNPFKYVSEEIKFCGRIVAAFQTANFNPEQLANLKKIHELFTKYGTLSYQNDPKGLDFPGVNPQLYDAVLSGTKVLLDNHSVMYYSQETEEDIKAILKLTPLSINYNLGKCGYARLKVSPLYMACLNQSIPTSVVNLILKSGANPNSEIDVFERPTKIIIDLKSLIMPERYELILALFQKYGLESI